MAPWAHGDWRYWECGIVGGIMSLGAGFEVSEALSVPAEPDVGLSAIHPAPCLPACLLPGFHP